MEPYLLLKFLDDHGGFFSFIAVILVLFLFLMEQWLNYKKKIEEQKTILRNLKFEIEKIKEDCKGYKKDIKKGGFSYYPIKQLNIFYYLTNITESINKSFSELTEKKLKDKLSLINDKVILINRYNDYIMKEYNKTCLSKVKNIRITPGNTNTFLVSNNVYFYWSNHTRATLKELSNCVNEVLKILKKY